MAARKSGKAAKAVAKANENALRRKHKAQLRAYLADLGGDAASVKRWKVLVRTTDSGTRVCFKKGKTVLRTKPEVARHLGVLGAAKSRKAAKSPKEPLKAGSEESLSDFCCAPS